MFTAQASLNSNRLLSFM